MTAWGLPPDASAWACLFVGSLLLGGRGLLQRRLALLDTRAFLALLALASFFLSVGYVEYYLRGGPRIIDATSYWLQARTYASLQLAYDPSTPAASHIGRFLLPTPDGRLSVIFPPGYPLLLALGARLNAEMLVGPVLGALLTVATYWLAQLSTHSSSVARLAAALTVPCAVLRYHTADTMSHGLSALLMVTALAAALERRARWSLLSGLALGWLMATRPATGVVAAILCLTAVASLRASSRWELSRRLAGLSLCGLGLGAFVWQQRAVTGQWFQSSQYAYYALAEPDPECFRFGLGHNVGCRVEHGEFVAKYLPDGYGVVEALSTTSRRLAQHLSDAGNQELFAVLIVVGALGSLALPRLRLLALGILLQIAIYAGFYFDGNYPGGGARMYAEVIPFELILVAWALWRLQLMRLGLPLMLWGFALHAVFAHQSLAARDGGRPMYEPSLAADVATPALVYLTTDHGYNLAYDPSEHAPLQIVRSKDPALDFAAWVEAGRPAAYRYDFDFMAGSGQPRLHRVQPKPSGRFEFESQWPPLALHTGSVVPVAEAPCSPSRALLLTPRGSARLVVAVWVEAPDWYTVEIAASRSAQFELDDERLEWGSERRSETCVASRARLRLNAGEQRLSLIATQPTLLDFIEVLKAAP